MVYDIVIGRGSKDREKYGLKGCVLLGKQWVKMGRTTSLSNKVYMDVTRSHVVFVCGKRGSGKCLTGDSLVRLSNGDQIPIRNLKDKMASILSLNEDGRFVPTCFDQFYERTVSKLIKLRLQSGKEIKLTPEHPLLTRTGWVEAQYLGKNSSIASYTLAFSESQVQDEKTGLISLLHSQLVWDSIDKIEILEGEYKVYDIGVPQYHNFVANDIVVHNSYTMGGIAEGMADLPKEISENLSIIILDTMGVYWSMKYPNHKDEDLLQEWGFKGKGLDVMIYTPEAYFEEYKKQGVPTDKPFTIKPSELTPEDWFLTFDLQPADPVAVTLEKAVLDLKETGEDFGIDDIIAKIREDDKTSETIRGAAENRLLSTKAWGVFSKEGTPLTELVKGGQVTVLDLSAYATMPGGWKVKALVLGIISMRMFIERMATRKAEEVADIQSAEHYLTQEGPKKKRMPMVWLIIDEAHEFLPRVGKTAASEALITILREGRQPGVSLILATQQPGKIHTDVMTQSDILLSHRITTQIDIKALGELMQSYLAQGLDTALMNLSREKGSAIIVDDTNERMYPIRMRPRFTWHGGEAPTAMPTEKKMFEFE